MEEIIISPDEKVCYNCKHLAWLIGVGQGLRCSHPKQEPKAMPIPSRQHTCELFDRKERLNDPNT
jgi:hypothetical protein